MRYAELQVTTNFSFLRGGSHPQELVAQAKALGLAAIAVTDRNTLAGVVRAHVAARDLGLRLVVGARLDLEDAASLIALPTDRAAYGRLSRLISLGQMRSEKSECSLRLGDVATHAEGMIFVALPPDEWDWRETSAASHREAGPAPHAALFATTLCLLREALGSGADLYLAASHAYRGDDRARIAALAALARRHAMPLVATGDVLYHAPHRRPLHDVLTAVRLSTTVMAAGLALAPNAERHLKSPSEMARLFKGHEDALARTLEITQACRFSLDELVYEYPDEPVPAGTTPQAHLESLAREGARWRFPGGVPDKVAATLDRELAIIADLGYAPYFLTVHDIVAFARSRAILCQGRGSAANSVVCYCLAVTSVNPTEVDLLFERFVSPERKEPPDIDVDFEHERREEIIQYIYARYGRDRAGIAATVISYRARSAVRDVGKAMGLTEDTVAALAGMVWGTRSGGALPEAHIREAGIDPADPLVARVIELTGELVGFPRHLSQHVGGFVLTRGPLVEVVPVGNAAMQGRTFIEWDKDDIAALGLLKVDVLALGMLTCIRRAFDLVARHHGRPLTLAAVPREDAAVYDMLCKADSIGVFQVESRAQMNMLPRLKPRTFYDLVIEVAIVRPGPIQGDMVHPYLRRRSGQEPEIYPSPSPGHGDEDELRNILAKTKGVPLFQEQAMRIAMVAARFTDAEVNELRKAMATFRRVGTIGRLEEKMVSGMVARGYAPEFAARCFSQIKGFGEYGFPESHAASFALLVYVSAWIKCHYPAAFACALLNSQPMGFYAPAQIVRDAREHGVEVRAVDVNHSHWDCALEAASPSPRLRGEGHAGGMHPTWGEGQPQAAARVAAPHPNPLPMKDGEREQHVVLRLGFRQVDGLQQEEIERLIAARDRSGHYRDVHDLQARSGVRLATLERLAAADTMRSLGFDRRQALWEVKGLASAEPLPLFQWGASRDTGDEPAVELPAMALSEHVVDDYRTLRLSLKAHPMSFLRQSCRSMRIAACADLRGMRDGTTVSVAGVVLVRQRPGSAKGVVFMTIEDETGVANAVVWPKTLERFRRIVMTARLIVIRGRIQRHEDIIHVVSARLEDRSAWLSLLSDQARDMKVPLANADEVLNPDPGSARGVGGAATRNQSDARGNATEHPRFARHPRVERVIPRSRDFH